MKTPIKSAMLVAACTLGASTAMAQTKQDAPKAAMPQVTAATNVSDAEVDAFAKAVAQLNTIEADTSIDKPAKQKKMIATLQASGLKPQRFNGIAKAAQTDPKVRARVSAAMGGKAAAGK